jgi:hypothetical protein
LNSDTWPNCKACPYFLVNGDLVIGYFQRNGDGEWDGIWKFCNWVWSPTHTQFNMTSRVELASVRALPGSMEYGASFGCSTICLPPAWHNGKLVPVGFFYRQTN